MPFDADWLDWFLEICFIPRTRKTNDQICLLPVACYYTHRHWVRRHCGKPPIPKMMPPCISLCMAFCGTGLLRLVLSWSAPTTSSAFCSYTNNCNKKNKILLWLYFLIDLPECELSYLNSWVFYCPHLPSVVCSTSGSLRRIFPRRCFCQASCFRQVPRTCISLFLSWMSPLSLTY